MAPPRHIAATLRLVRNRRNMRVANPLGDSANSHPFLPGGLYSRRSGLLATGCGNHYSKFLGSCEYSAKRF